MSDQDLSTRSVAIAGAWGYIGRKFLNAANELGIRPYVHDPGPMPDDVDADRLTRVAEAVRFYQLPVDFFHLALHPEHRQLAYDLLLERARREPFLMLCEKPMATPDNPETCGSMVDAAQDLKAIVLYDFPELFDEITRRIEDFLGSFGHVRVTEIQVTRSKDREDLTNPRNYKRMVPIQYQESVHCLAFVLHLLGKLRGDLASVFESGLSVRAQAEPYIAPNPEDYPHVVDGRCRFELTLGQISVVGHTDFKSGATWTKRRVLAGTADGKPFRIEAEYLEGHKRLIINGVDQGCDPAADSYRQVLVTGSRWQRSEDPRTLMTGVFPNPAFARLTYQLSSVLWRSSIDGVEIRLPSVSDLIAFDARFRAQLPNLPRYGTSAD